MNNDLEFGNTIISTFKPFAKEGPTAVLKDISGKEISKEVGPDSFIVNMPINDYNALTRKQQDKLIDFSPEDPRHNNIKYKARKIFENIIDSPYPTFVGRILNKGPLHGGVAGGGAGFLAGAIADTVLDKINGEPRNPLIDLKLIGTIGGAGLGAALGFVRKKHDAANSLTFKNNDPSLYINDLVKSSNYIEKRAIMYKDPRNYILERLQSATDVGFAEKAKLAGAVRNLDNNRASELAKIIRASLGFGIGALISKFLFGMTSTRGTVLGGLIGLIGTGLFNNLIK